MKPGVNAIKIILCSFIHYRTNYYLFFYPLPSLKFGGKLSEANCPGGELSGIRFFHQSHDTVHFGGLFTLKQWIFSSLKHDPVPRENKLYCFYVKNPQNVLHYGIVKTVNSHTISVIHKPFPGNHHAHHKMLQRVYLNIINVGVNGECFFQAV